MFVTLIINQINTPLRIVQHPLRPPSLGRYNPEALEPYTTLPVPPGNPFIKNESGSSARDEALSKKLNDHARTGGGRLGKEH